MPNEVKGYRKIRASELPAAEQDRLRKALRQELTDALIKAIRSEPADVDLTKIEVMLRPGQGVGHWHAVADCSTCSTCGTCATCSTCSTVAAPADVPVTVARDLGVALGRAPRRNVP
jgi:hypothetical protein